MRFDINNYKGKYVMHCDTEEKANTFLFYLDSIGKRWDLGGSYLKDNYFSYYKEYTAYSFNKGQYCSVDYFRRTDYIVLEFDDFDWSDDSYDDNEVSDEELLDFIGGIYEI